jgi:hypothetical protein
MMTPSVRDVENLSAFLDGQLSRAEQTRLEARLRSEPALAAALEDLRLARQILRRTPRRAVPRNFTLTPKMAGIRPPVPRVIPALSWASAVAMLVFIFTAGSNLFGQLLSGAGAPMLAAAPMSAEGYGVGGGPLATQPPVADNTLSTSTPEALLMAAPQATTPDETLRTSPPPVPVEKAAPEAVINWPFLWLGLALVLIATALLVRLLNIRAFRRKVVENHKP